MNICKYIAVMGIALTAASCAEEIESTYYVEKPSSLTDYEYLNDYKPLKEYITNDNFHIAAGVTATEFVNGGSIYLLAKTNFNEVVAGNAMKYASCVSDKGTMDFSTVESFVEKAKSAGIGIYGHVLCWHSQQNITYLKSLIKDKPDPSAMEKNNVLKIVTPEAKANSWDWQMFYDLDELLETGTSYTITLKIKASEATKVDFWPNLKDNSNPHYLSPFNATTDWTTQSVTFTPKDGGIERLIFSFGPLGGTLYFDDVHLTKTGDETEILVNNSFDEDDLTHWTKPSWHGFTYAIFQEEAAGTKVIEEPYEEELITNSDCNKEDYSNYVSTEPDFGTTCETARTSEAGQGADGGSDKCMIIKSPAEALRTWDTQFFIKTSHTFTTGETATLKMKIKADVAMSADGCQAHNNPGGYKHWAFFTNPDFTTEWVDYTSTITISAEQDGTNTVAFNLSNGANNDSKNVEKIAVTPNVYYFDNVSLVVSGVKTTTIEAAGIPLTDQEKHDTLYWALDKWIAGMMKACNGYVTAWDAVNEAISGAAGANCSIGSEYYSLQTPDNMTQNEADQNAANNFYWQQYMGKDYVRDVIKIARERGAEYGAPNLQLFINDYNLESDWDNNHKLESLIAWINYWESDGVTKIDGIGTQMHITCYEDATTEASKEQHITRMFELMAATGKLCRISELDMGYVDANGNSVLTANITLEQQKKMAELYKFVVKQYRTIIPEAQQYGICQWCPTDSPSTSSWRAGQPTGLWTEDYQRKPQYAGFANGLSE